AWSAAYGSRRRLHATFALCVVRGPWSVVKACHSMYSGMCDLPRTTDHRPMTKVAILGGSGYTALELIKILLRHPHAEIVAVTSRQEGTPLVAEQHPSLTGRIDLRCEPFDADRLVARGVKCAFGCLPHGVSMSTVPALLQRGLRVIDL